MKLRVASALAAALAWSACTKANPRFCDEETPCTDPDRPFCDLDGSTPASEGTSNSCVPAPDDDTVGDDSDDDPVRENFSLTVTLSGNGSGTVLGPADLECDQEPCTASFAAGSEIQLSARAIGDDVFVGWGGVCDGFGTCTIAMTEDREVHATFSIARSIDTVVSIAGQRLGPPGDEGDLVALEDGGTLWGATVEESIVIGEAEIEVDSASGILARFDANGDLMWHRLVGESVRALAPTREGAIAAIFEEDDVAGVIVDIELQDGSFNWERTISASGDGFSILSLASTPTGEIVLSGAQIGTIDFGPFELFPQAQLSGYVAWLSERGQFVRARRLGSRGDRMTQPGIPVAVHVAATGDVYATGITQTSIDFLPNDDERGEKRGETGGFYYFLGKYNPQGSFEWSHLIGAPDGRDGALSLVLPRAVTADEDVLFYASGNETLSLDQSEANIISDLDRDVFLARYSAQSGAFVNAKAYRSADRESTFIGDTSGAIELDVRGQLSISGAFEGILDFGGASVSCRVDCVCGFVATLAPASLEPIWSTRIESQESACRIAAAGPLAFDSLGRVAVLLGASGRARVGGTLIDVGEDVDSTAILRLNP